MSNFQSRYVRLNKAADMLGTDVDTLLLAGVEHRIYIYALVSAWGERGKDDLLSDTYYLYALVTRFAKLITDGEMKIDRLLRRTEGSTLEDSDFESHKPDEAKQSEVIARRDHLFMLRSDIEEILKSTTTQDEKKELMVPQHKGALTRRTDTLLTVIAALCKEANIDPKEKGSAARIARMTDKLSAPVSEAAIKPLLDSLPDAVAKRKK